MSAAQITRARRAAKITTAPFHRRLGRPPHKHGKWLMWRSRTEYAADHHLIGKPVWYMGTFEQACELARHEMPRARFIAVLDGTTATRGWPQTIAEVPA